MLRSRPHQEGDKVLGGPLRTLAGDEGDKVPGGPLRPPGWTDEGAGGGAVSLLGAKMAKPGG